MPINRKEQQADLIFKFGQLLSPLQQLVDMPDEQTPQTRARASAKFSADLERFQPFVHQFSEAEPGHHYEFEARKIYASLNLFNANIGEFRDDQSKLVDHLAKTTEEVLRNILAVPTEVDSEVLEAQSPFQSYCKLKVFFETTSNTIIWADPYAGSGLFHRYLNDLADSVSVTLVTKDRGNHHEYQSFLDISRLYAQERGPEKYRLIIEGGHHDRWLQCDQQIYHLGGSAKDAGKRSPFTITKLEPSKDNFKKLQDLISSGTELFGPNQTSHL